MFRISKIVACLLVLSATLAFGRAAQAGYAHFIYDVKTNQVLASENANELNHPASLTKMMTLYMTFEALKARRVAWDQDILITPNAASKIPSKLGVPAGRTITVREAVEAMIVRSANDAAAAMGDFLGGTEEQFGQMMTRRARQLGMSRTVFRNASGLPDDAQVTTARDMAVLALALIRDFPREYQLFSMRNMEFRGKRLRGHNNLMYRYPGMDGVKTGYIKASGFNIASAVTIDGRRVIGVVMGGKTARARDDRMAALLDQYVPSNRLSVDGALVAAQEQKQTAEQPAPLAFATAPRKQITMNPGSAAGQPARASIANLYAAPSQGVPPKNLPLQNPQVAAVAPVAPQAQDSLWRVQIAAGITKASAVNMIDKAISLLSGFNSVSPLIEAATYNGKQAYNARLAGFADRETATRACTVLQAKSMNCFVVR
jgi:D-alanyl-D-alanine carboxypeptidase